ncbi:MAG: hypothetical protein KGZ97_09510 [Bacteroidetes bacterium]|nr:hypothetical protein [Bacteroidota bacterium]
MKPKILKNVTIITFSLFVLLTTVLFISCNKESEIVEKSVETIFNEVVFTDSKGSVISIDDASLDLPDAVLILMEDKDSRSGIKAQYFKTEEDAYKYISEIPELTDAKEKMDFARRVRSLAEKTGDINVEDPELFSKEMKTLLASYNPIADRGMGLLYDLSPPAGDYFPITGNAQVSLFSFNNRATSAQGFGLANWLWSRTWFRGSAVYLLLGTAHFIPLKDLNFDNQACSSL